MQTFQSTFTHEQVLALITLSRDKTIEPEMLKQIRSVTLKALGIYGSELGIYHQEVFRKFEQVETKPDVAAPQVDATVLWNDGPTFHEMAPQDYEAYTLRALEKGIDVQQKHITRLVSRGVSKEIVGIHTRELIALKKRLPLTHPLYPKEDEDEDEAKPPAVVPEPPADPPQTEPEEPRPDQMTLAYLKAVLPETHPYYPKTQVETKPPGIYYQAVIRQFKQVETEPGVAAPQVDASVFWDDGRVFPPQDDEALLRAQEKKIDTQQRYITALVSRGVSEEILDCHTRYLNAIKKELPRTHSLYPKEDEAKPPAVVPEPPVDLPQTEPEEPRPDQMTVAYLKTVLPETHPYYPKTRTRPDGVWNPDNEACEREALKMILNQEQKLKELKKQADIDPCLILLTEQSLFTCRQMLPEAHPLYLMGSTFKGDQGKSLTELLEIVKELTLTVPNEPEIESPPEPAATVTVVDLPPKEQEADEKPVLEVLEKIEDLEREMNRLYQLPGNGFRIHDIERELFYLKKRLPETHPLYTRGVYTGYQGISLADLPKTEEEVLVARITDSEKELEYLKRGGASRRCIESEEDRILWLKKQLPVTHVLHPDYKPAPDYDYLTDRIAIKERYFDDLTRARGPYQNTSRLRSDLFNLKKQLPRTHYLYPRRYLWDSVSDLADRIQDKKNVLIEMKNRGEHAHIIEEKQVELTDLKVQLLSEAGIRST